MFYVSSIILMGFQERYLFRNLVRKPQNQKTSQLQALMTKLSRTLGFVCFTQIKSIWKEVFKEALTLVTSTILEQELQRVVVTEYLRALDNIIYITNIQKC